MFLERALKNLIPLGPCHEQLTWLLMREQHPSHSSTLTSVAHLSLPLQCPLEHHNSKIRVKIKPSLFDATVNHMYIRH